MIGFGRIQRIWEGKNTQQIIRLKKQNGSEIPGRIGKSNKRPPARWQMSNQTLHTGTF